MQSEARGIAVLRCTKCWELVVFVQYYMFLVRGRDRRGSDVFLLSISKHWPAFGSVLKDGHCSFCVLPLPAGIGRVWVWVEFSMPQPRVVVHCSHSSSGCPPVCPPLSFSQRDVKPQRQVCLFCLCQILWFWGQIRESPLSYLFVYKVSQLEVAVLAPCPQVSHFLSHSRCLVGWAGVGGLAPDVFL